MLVLAVASVLHYFGIFTFHSEHYLVAYFFKWILLDEISGFIGKLKAKKRGRNEIHNTGD